MVNAGLLCSLLISSHQYQYSDVKQSSFSLQSILSTVSSSDTVFPNNKAILQKWRLYNIEILHDDDPGKDSVLTHSKLIDSIFKSLKCPKGLSLSINDVIVVKKAFDARWKKFGQPKWVYTVDITIPRSVVNKIKLREVQSKVELVSSSTISTKEVFDKCETKKIIPTASTRIIIVGAGPTGLFAAITLVNAGYKPVIIERGFPVEIRGRDIGALFNRKILNEESNLCYGEGGAGTWSDGKLTTRIGKNSEDVRHVLQSLVDHGAPERILVDSKPHLGTDRLVRILKNLRAWLIERGAEFKFGTKVDDILTSSSSTVSGIPRITGVVLASGEKLLADFVVLAVGHSARLLYTRLHQRGVKLLPKPIAVGFRVEHPQELINKIQYGDKYSQHCLRGKGTIPVADYRLATQIPACQSDLKKRVRDGISLEEERSCYSFCMCPGGQIVPTSVNPEELCINGMSFSQRQSPFANSALVVNVDPEDLGYDPNGNSEETRNPMIGVDWQRSIERKAAYMGGGLLVSPVQRVTDFLSEVATPCDGGMQPVSPYYSAIEGTAAKIPSSYRMGVKGAACHTIYPHFVTEALQKALQTFDRQLPGFITPDGILHGVETRTSSPVQIIRDGDSMECLSMLGLYPAGEGAGYAGGIVSAAVDGVNVGKRIIDRASGVAHESVHTDTSTSIITQGGNLTYNRPGSW